MRKYEKYLKSILAVYKATTFRTFSSRGLNIPQTQLEYLAAKGLITIVPHGGNSFDYRITVEDRALTYFDEKIDKRIRFWIPLTVSILALLRPEITILIKWIIGLFS